MEHEKNNELKEKQDLQTEFKNEEEQRKIRLMEKEHEFKMERLEKQLEIAKVTGQKGEEEN